MSVNDQSMTIGDLFGSGSVTLGTKATTLLTLTSANFGGVISGTGAVKFTGGATLTGANTYTGGTTISGGALSIGSGTATGSITGNITDNSRLIFNRSNAVTYSGVISGTGSVTQGGTGVLSLTGNNTYDGGTLVHTGVLLVSNANQVGSGAISMDTGAELRTSGTVILNNEIDFSSAGSSTLSTNGTLTVGSLGMQGSTTFGSPGNAGAVVVTGFKSIANGSILTVADGTLRNGGGLNSYTSAPVFTTVNAGATLDLNGQNLTVTVLQGNGKVTLGANPASILFLSSGNFGGVISGTGQMETSQDTVTLTGANTYTGGTTITSESTLQIGNSTTTGSIVGNVVNNGALVFQRNNALTYSGSISGLGTVTQIGGGVLTLSGNSSYTGGTQVKLGVLAVASGNALGTGAVFMAAGTELRGSGTVTLPNQVTIPTDSTVVISSNGTFTLQSLTIAKQSEIIFGSLGNTGTVTFASNASLTASTENSLAVLYGTLSNGGSLNSLTTTATSTFLASGTTLSLNDLNLEVKSLGGSGSVTLGTKAATTLFLDGGGFQGVISGAGHVVGSPGTGNTTALAGTNTYTGGTTADSGTLEIGLGGTTGSVVGNIIDNANLTFFRSNAYNFGGVISGPGSVTIREGTITLSGNNTYTGGTTIASGAVLVLTNPTAAGPALSSINLTNGSELRTTGTFALSDNLNFPTGPATVSTTGTLTLNDAQFRGNVVFGSPGNAGVIMLGGGGGVTNSPTFEVAYGTLRESSAGIVSFITSQGAFTTVDAGATLDANGNNLTIQELQGAGSVKLGTNSSAVLTLNGGAFGGVISGAGQVNIAGIVALFGSNTYTGGTTIAGGGILKIGFNGTGGSVTGNIVDNGNLTFLHTNAYTFGGIISGTGSVTNMGPGLVTLSGNNTYTGGTTIFSGSELVLTNPFAAGPALSVISLRNDSELRTIGTFTLNDNLQFSNGVGTISTTGTLTVEDALFQGKVVFGSAGYAGVIVLGGGNVLTNTPTAEIAFGTLRESDAGNVNLLTSNSPNTTVAAGAKLDAADHNITVKNLAGLGSVTLGSKASTVLTLDDVSSFGGVISGAGQVTISSSVTLSGANTYTGGTLIQSGGGQLQLGSGGTTGSVTGNITDNGQLIFLRNSTSPFSNLISGTGDVYITGNSFVTLSGNNTYTGHTYVTGGVLAVSNSNALSHSNVVLSPNTELRGSGTVTLTNEIVFSSTPGETLSSTGTMTVSDIFFTANNTLHIGSTGNTGTVAVAAGGPHATTASNDAIAVDFGTLRNAGGLDFFTSAIASTTVNSGAKLDVNDQSMQINQLQGTGTVTLGSKATTVLTLERGNFAGVISGAGKVATGGTVTLSGASTYSGGTTITTSTLVVKNTTGSATGTGPVNIGNGGALGGNGKISGAINLNHSGFLEPGIASIGTAGTILHGSSMIWNGGGGLDFQIGSTADELILTGALTKGLAGTYDIEIDDAGITTGNFTVATFASTTFAPADFTLQLPANATGMLVDNGHSLVVDITSVAHNEGLPHTELLAAPEISEQDPVATPSTFTMASTPEPAGFALLAFGAIPVLTGRFRRSAKRHASSKSQ